MNTSSILARLGIRSRVLLRDLGREDSPVLRVSSPEAPPVSMAQERYQIVGEIARGGIGVVLKGRDTDLGRDVAMKVLRPEHARNEDLVERFVEEAQIEGQLQHPGIVPVYELGLRDKRPYFTMRLVKGQTLAALLAARADPAQDRRRFLGIFAHVCQTMAYAHARGVLHRDLKPSNVMVGAFGEVLVVDWGFAKVMQQEERQRDLSVVRTRRAQSGSGSLAGSVVGTPAYMPPEQALGDAASLDARADVFSLGAILCEILTGAPPYGGQGSDPLLQATRAELQDALARLDACGTEAELVATAKACLAPARAERPADAGAVAKRVGDHLAAVEERARRAQVEAAEATVRARGDRKARRLTLGLASAVAIALVAGGVGWWRLESDRRDRADARATRVRAALAEAAQRRGEAEGLGLAGWEGASGAAKAAVELARAPETPDALRGEAERFAAQVDEDAAAARAQAKQTQIDADTVARLTEVRGRRSHTLNRFQSDDEYAAAFRECVGDIDALASADAAARIAASAIRTELCAALDDWVSLKPGRAPRLLDVLRIADPDPWRTEVRRAATTGNVDLLRTLAGQADPAAQPAQSITLLAAALSHAAETEAAIALLRRSFPHHPDDVWTHLLLAHSLSHRMIRGFDEAVRHFRAALALRPRSVEVLHHLGIALSETGRHDEALAAWEDALAVDPSYAHAYLHIVETERKKGTLSTRIGELRRAVEKDTLSAILWLQLGLAYHWDSNWTDAAEALRRALELDPACTEAEEKLGVALVQAGRPAEARERLEGLVQRLPKTSQSSRAWNTLGLARGALGDRAAAIEAYLAAIDISGDGEYWNNLATAFVREGDIEQAAVACRETLKRGGPSWVVPSVAHGLAGLGRREDAVELCREAEPVLLKQVEAYPRLASGTLEALGAIRCDFLGDFDGAIETYRKAIERNQLDNNARFNLGNAHLKKADVDGALAAYQEFLEMEPDGQRGHVGCATVLRQLGRLEEALAKYRDAERLGYPEDDWLGLGLGWTLVASGRTQEGLGWLRRCAERQRGPQAQREEALSTVARVAPKLPVVLRGEPVSIDARETLVLAEMCNAIGRSARGESLYRQAFDQDPALLVEPWPFLAGWRWGACAACTAVWAGTGRGVDAPASDEERAALRARALAWLRIDLDDRRRQLDRSPDARATVRTALSAWKIEQYLAPVRYEPHLQLLPAAERAAWQAFWQEVDDVLARTRP